MFSLFNFGKINPSANPEADALVKEFAQQEARNYPFKLENFTAGVKFKNAEPQFQRDVVFGILHWIEQNSYSILNHSDFWSVRWKMNNIFLHMLKGKLPFSEADVISLLKWSASTNSEYSYLRGIPQTIKVAGDYLKKNEMSSPLAQAIDELIHEIQQGNQRVQVQRWILRLKELKGDSHLNLPLTSEDVWAAQAISDINSLELKEQNAWAEVLLHCLRSTGSTPSEKWIKRAAEYLNVIGMSNFRASLLSWYALVDQPRSVAHTSTHQLAQVNTDILKGLIWLCGQSEDAGMARAITDLAVSAYKKIPGTGPRAAKVGNACFWSLGNMPGSEGVAQLSILKLKIKTNTAQRIIQGALDTASRRLSISTEEIEEMSVPSYGLSEVGLQRYDFGEVVSEVRVNGSDVEQVWIKKDGKQLSSAPRAVKDKYADELKAIAQSVKDIRKMLPAQRDRIDNLFLAQRKWPFDTWMTRYINHPLVGTIARRLIWQFRKDKLTASGIWLDGQWVGTNNQPIDWLDSSTLVELWHPINVETTEVLLWRKWLMEHEVRQPFKQAYREIYLLTDAEINTDVYSNRYAAHILRQHQFHSLCAAKGWKNALQLMVDADFPPARKILSNWGLRAEYWIEGIGNTFGTDTNETGTFLYLTTDQVRFYPIHANENRAHSGGGGYAAQRWNGQAAAEPLPLKEIPALVFSEIMRDVDMFVGVASIGNDPNWLDGGREIRYQDYWHTYSFGELTESAKTRRQILETLLPRLKIAQRCTLSEKFLFVKGDLRTYKIHLGSGNILMEPNDQYLCIVPARKKETGDRERLFVPFEGDQVLAIILSKAFMLAEDRKISDKTITRQING